MSIVYLVISSQIARSRSSERNPVLVDVIIAIIIIIIIVIIILIIMIVIMIIVIIIIIRSEEHTSELQSRP